MVGYKVCRLLDGVLYSYMFLPMEGGVEYKIGKYVHPKPGCGPLCVFTTLEDAQKFGIVDAVLYKCEYVPSRRTDVWRYCYSRSLEDLCAMQRLKNVALATRVKLLEKIA